MKNELIYRGTIFSVKHCFDIPEEGLYLLSDVYEEDFIFQIVSLDRQKIGTIGGLIKTDLSITNQRAISLSHFDKELERNFLNVDLKSVIFYESIDLLSVLINTET